VILPTGEGGSFRRYRFALGEAVDEGIELVVDNGSHA
jgi:hypothetical protein